METILGDKVFMEALAFSNQKVYRAIQRRVSQQLIETVTKYYIRYKYRPTPYGFFSGISNCRFGENTQIIRDTGKNTNKDIKVDFEWFYKVLRLLESNKNILENVEVKFSENCYPLGDRLINPCFSNYGEIEENTNVQKDICRIRYSKQVKKVEALSKEWINYKKLINELSIINSGVPKAVIDDFMEKLINNSFLITNLRVPLTNQDPLEELLEVVRQFKVEDTGENLIQELSNINELRREYCEIKLGDGIETLFKLIEMMENVCPSKNYLGAIIEIPLEKDTISIEVKKELENLGRLISAFELGDNEGHYIYQFKNEFVNKYGVNTEVPFLEVMDATMGIGDPYTKRLEQEVKLSAKTEQLRKVILDKICFCLKQGENKITLGEKEIKYFEDYKDDKNGTLNIASTFDLGIEIYAEKESDIDKGNFCISFSPGLGALTGGQLVNRFYKLFNDFTKNELKRMYDCAMDNKDYLIVDTSCFHPKARANNICTGNKNYQYSLDIQVKSDKQSNINMGDIVMGYDSRKDRLYLKSRQYNKKLKILGDYMLNQDTLSHTIRTLWEISSSYEKNSLESLVIILESISKYTPQICFGRTILVNEQWQMDRTDFEDIKSFEKFCENFKDFAIEWKMPRFIILAIRDRTLFIDLENDEYLHILYKEIEKQLEIEGKVKVERAKQIDNIWQKDIKGNCYSAEYIVHFLKQDAVENNIALTAEEEKISKSIQSFYDKNRVFQPGEQGWFYFNIYIEEKKADEFLQIFLTSLISKIISNNVEKIFFIRYSDPDFHIRFRLKLGNTEVNNSFLKDNFLLWFTEIREQGYSYKYTLTPYEREVERYGGIELIDLAEKIFTFESILSLEILSSYKRQEEKEDVVVCVLVDTLLCLYEEKMELVEEYLDDFIEQKEFRKEFSEVRKRLLKHFENKDILERLIKTTEFSSRREVLNEYKKGLNHHEKQGTLTNYKQDIIMSLLHMFCNRINGDRYWERKMLSFARHVVHDLNSRKKYLQNEKI